MSAGAVFRVDYNERLINIFMWYNARTIKALYNTDSNFVGMCVCVCVLHNN